MIKRLRIISWFSFCALIVLTRLVDSLWRFDWWEVVLSILAILSTINAAIIIYIEGVRPVPVGLVIFGLIFGQWWLVESVLMISFWYFRGFV